MFVAILMSVSLYYLRMNIRKIFGMGRYQTRSNQFVSDANRHGIWIQELFLLRLLLL